MVKRIQSALLLGFAGSSLVAGMAIGLGAPLHAEDARTSAPATQANAPVLVELFTSQGCSSCPPADKFAAKLAKEGRHIVVSRPVTYWDRLGWKDTLAREENTQLQRAYAARGLAGRNGVYTPQIVVDGERGAVGANEAVIRNFIANAATAPAAIAIRQQDNGALAVGLAGSADDAELVLLAITSHVTVKILRGENGNRAIGYTNVLRDETVIADWQGGKTSLSIAANTLRHPLADRYALVLREKGAGRVLAARMVG